MIFTKLYITFMEIVRSLRVNSGNRRYCGEIAFGGACAGAYGDPRPAISVGKGISAPGDTPHHRQSTTKQAQQQKRYTSSNH